MNTSALDLRMNQTPKPKASSRPTLGAFFDTKETPGSGELKPTIGAFFDAKKSPISLHLKAKLNRSIRCDGSVSELSHSVNDSARGKTFDEVYRKKEVLGEGGYAFVYRCVHKNRRNHYAVKEVHHEDYETTGENINEEISALKRLREGPYIVRLLDVFRGPEQTFLVMEQMKGGDLLERLVEKEVFSENQSRRISRKLIEAVVYCHKKEIAHRDIKLENILLADHIDDTKIKLADFGCAHPFVPGEKSLRTLCGSPQYAAPELYMHENGYDEKCDIWSIGVVIFVLLGGYAPFEGSNMELPGIICEGYFDFPAVYWEHISEHAKSLITSLLVVNPDNRATLFDALDSEWLRRRDKESFLHYSNHAKLDGSSVFQGWVKSQKEASPSRLNSPPKASHSEVSEATESSESTFLEEEEGLIE
eukprot:CAMPEP_0197279372 /NCGR_PEP_ID=MMETSP1432-20130617/20001_1 /TAXON_ID=44447 /ORGANISM="Pseudo-nitzschia delicatissima, Strain UNC1205" /LENGTH=419 /DNA_ID=CAMNT_0042745905 /DNA_START=55 /DNA_END=1314 /DNA_ORIENTATION=+